jgi:ATP-dependent RNA helicase SUPV3L1/SUV3
LSPAARGLLYQLEQSLGTLFASEAAGQIAELTDADAAALQRAGIRIGRRFVYVPAMLKPRAIAERSVLLSVWVGNRDRVPSPRLGAVSMRVDARAEKSTHLALGYPVLGARAVRADIAEELGCRLDEAHKTTGGRAFPLERHLANLTGCPARELPSIAEALGFRVGPLSTAGREKRRA